MNNNYFFGMVKIISWLSLILFLVDYANRSGKWWFHLIAMSVFIFTTLGIAKEIIGKHKENKREGNKK